MILKNVYHPKYLLSIMILTMSLNQYQRRASAFTVPYTTTRRTATISSRSRRPPTTKSSFHLSYQNERIMEGEEPTEEIGIITPDAANLPSNQQQQPPQQFESQDSQHLPAVNAIDFETMRSDPIIENIVLSGPSSALISTSQEERTNQQQNMERKIILPMLTAQDAPATSTTSISSTDEDADMKKDNAQQLIMPSISTNTNSSKKQVTTSNTLWSRISSKVQKWWKSFDNQKHILNKRPGMKFRVRLIMAAIGSMAISGLLLPQQTTLQLLSSTRAWLFHRGFQGISALGRSVAYGWALFVGYPRLLDRRAQEKARNQYELKLDRRRSYLERLANDVTRLQNELSKIDREIRAFRREIIALKAYAKDNDTDIQEAIGAEMTHLAQLRVSTQSELAAAKQTWVEARSQSPPEAWE